MCSNTTEPHQRLFFALWPDSAVRRALAKSSRELLGRRIKPVPVENLHITLAFAGPVTAPVRDCLEAAAGEIHCAPFELEIDHVGHWPRPRILWVGPTHTPAGLWSLVEALNLAFDACGLQLKPGPSRRTSPWRGRLAGRRRLPR